MPDFRMADLEVHGQLLAEAHKWALRIDDKTLETPSYQILLSLFPYLLQMHMES
ncbi:MAG: hypothetical protein H6925_02205 [Holosporaceae bacterium]|nr:MAG: hypothetical protein H6925_02205 [Holosporaceae bacterium]